MYYMWDNSYKVTTLHNSQGSCYVLYVNNSYKVTTLYNSQGPCYVLYVNTSYERYLAADIKPNRVT